MNKIFASGVLALGIGFGVAGHASAALIDNGTMKPRQGGYCSSCGELDASNWVYMSFDTLALSSNSVLNAIAFEISLYTGRDPAGTDYRIDLRSTSGSMIKQWNFNGGDTDSITSLGRTTYTIAYGLGDYSVLAGDYLIGIGADYGAHSTDPADYIAGPDGDGKSNQYTVSDTGFSIQSRIGGDLPFRLTINEASAVPEPATLALLGFGLAGIGAARRKKQA